MLSIKHEFQEEIQTFIVFIIPDILKIHGPPVLTSYSSIVLNFQYNDNYQKALAELVKYPVKHLAAILLVVSGSRDEKLFLEVTEVIGRRGGQLAYDDVIIALIQVHYISKPEYFFHTIVQRFYSAA